MLVGKQLAVLEVTDVVPVRAFRVRPGDPILIGVRDRIVHHTAVVPLVQGKALADVRVILRSVIDAGLEIELQSLHHIDDRLEIRADTPRIEVGGCRFLGLGNRVPPATLRKEMLTTLRVDGMIGHSKNGFHHHASSADPSDIRHILVVQGQLGFQADPLGNVVVEIQPEIVALVAVVRVADHPLLVRKGPRQVVG